LGIKIGYSTYGFWNSAGDLLQGEGFVYKNIFHLATAITQPAFVENITRALRIALIVRIGSIWQLNKYGLN
jgi:hypothetical protein